MSEPLTATLIAGFVRSIVVPTRFVCVKSHVLFDVGAIQLGGAMSCVSPCVQIE